MVLPIDLASTLVGRREQPDRGLIQEYLRTGGVNMDPATQAWCAAFVNSTLAQSGLPTTGSNLARSFLDYGEPVVEPQRGDIAVYPSTGGFNHAGFVDSITGTGPGRMVRVLGGNVSDAVGYSTRPFGQALGFRRALAPAPQMTAQAAPPAPPQPAGPPGMPGPSAPTTPGWPMPPGPPQPPAPQMNDGSGLMPGMSQIAAQFVQQGEQRKQQEQARRQALFGGGSGLAGMFG